MAKKKLSIPENVLLLVQEGNEPIDAALIEGYTKEDFDEWMLDTNCKKQLARAEAKAAGDAVAEVRKLSKNGSLKASLEILRVSRPERWAPDSQIPKAPTINILNQTQVVNDPHMLEAKERMYHYAVQLFKENPNYYERLKYDMNSTDTYLLGTGEDADNEG